MVKAGFWSSLETIHKPNTKAHNPCTISSISSPSDDDTCEINWGMVKDGILYIANAK